MAKAGRIYHWKHGWIPLDATVGTAPRRKRTDAEKANSHPADIVNAVKKPRTRKPPNWVPPKDNVSTYKAPTAAERKKLIDAELAKSPAQIRAEEKAASDKDLLRKNYSDMTPAEKIRAAEIMYGKDSPNAKGARKIIEQAAKDAAAQRSGRYRTVDTVDGVEFVSYKSASMDPLGTDHGQPWKMTKAQQQTVADAYNEVKAEFPGMKPVQIVATQGMEGILGITTWDGRRISLSKNAFSDEQRALAHKNFGKHGAIAGQYTGDPEAFARATVVHELGHAMEMQTALAKRRGDALATQRVTPSEVGIDTSDWAPDAAKETVQRWMVDTLGQQSVYATGNQFEWFAEAFAEGWFNGDTATPQGKLALGILKDVYGKAAA